MEVPWIIVSLWTRAVWGQSYLAGEHRPLWILEDGLAKRHRQNRPEADYETTTRIPAALMVRRQGRGGGQEEEPGSITFLVRHDDRDAPSAPPPILPSLPKRRFMMPHRLQLPHRYVQPVQKTRSQRRGERRQLPVFDNGPGENSLQLSMGNYPVFVYNGTRGELILNTMLSRRRYPMQEPVPGQVLYPPSTPMFRPKPIVERFRFPGQREIKNLTLIPFYAQEAISDPTLTSTSTQAPTTSTTPMPSPYETQLPRIEGMLTLGKRKRKKGKQYEAFHSPQDVMQWQTVLRRSTGHNDNHRHHSSQEVEPEEQKELGDLSDGVEEELDEQDWLTSQEAETEVELPPEPRETSTASSSEPFQIVYIDESLERPTVETLSSTTPPTPLRHSSRYALKNRYYAFPVYTLGKLLQPQTQNPSKNLLEKSDRSARSSLEREPSTWFILNSRYKGPYHRSHGTHNQTKYYTSKYIENGFRPRR
ncbi:GM19024 [Drosophila sechellia]|uniref:GM19024 n=1 Tax=Drosophila sechellia TaxID=7238 RepID=B4I955_DROSE|nr:GM19024 [Drosophila sechellia]